jgi:hypothetical protein
MRNTNKPVRYFGEIQLLPSGEYKVAFMQRLVAVNQHKRKWATVSSREFARALNRGQLITR